MTPGRILLYAGLVANGTVIAYAFHIAVAALLSPIVFACCVTFRLR